MKASRFFNIAVGIVFIIAVSVPLITVNTTVGKISVAENRVLASRPSLKTEDGSINTSLINDFEVWFNDNLGLRDKLVMTNTKLQYNLFGTLTRNNTVKGENDWLYHMDPEMMKSYQNINLPSEEDYQKIHTTFSQLDKYFKDINIPVITMINPDKETIYPEFMPKTILKVNEQSRTDLIVDYLSKNTNIDFFNTKNSLLSAKKDATLYSKNYDLTHWNNYGAFVAYQDLIDRLKKYEPSIPSLTLDDFTITPYERTSELNGVLPFKETDYNFSLNKQYSAVMDRGLLNYLNINDSHLAYRYINDTKKDLPKLLIMGDSFMYMFMLPNIAESFSEVTFLHWNNMGDIKEFVNLFDPDMFVLEFMEPAIDQFVNSVSYPDEYFNTVALDTLPIVENQQSGLLWMDYVDNDLVESQEKITVIQNKGQSTSLVGWALDPKANNIAGEIYVKIGSEYYQGIYGLPRASVAEVYNNPNLLNSGFVFNVPSSELIKHGGFSLIVVSNDKTYQYEPIEVKVGVK